MKGLFIDAAARTVTEVQWEDYTDLRRFVDGPIEAAFRFANGDVCYVDEEGLYRGKAGWFSIEGGHQPFAGNGIITGRDEYHSDKEWTLDVATTIAELRPKLTFLTAAEVTPWLHRAGGGLL